MRFGRPQASYLSGERDDSAVWTWDGTLNRKGRPLPPSAPQLQSHFDAREGMATDPLHSGERIRARILAGAGILARAD